MKTTEFINLDHDDNDAEVFNTDDFTVHGSKREETPEGFLIVKDCVLTRTGLFKYPARHFQPAAFNDRAPTDMITVYRDPADVFNKDAMATFSGIAMTNEHPAEMLTIHNIKKHQVGHVNGEVRRDGNKMLGDLMVTDSATITAIKSGKEQLSNGYYSKYDFNAGTTCDGESFDCKQYAMRGNHVALVIKGRAGHECRVTDKLEEDFPMETITINGVTYEASKQVVQAVAGLQINLDTAEQKLAEVPNLDAAVDSAVVAANASSQATIDAQKVEIESLNSQVANLDSQVDTRMDIIAGARKLNPKFDYANKDNATIQKDIVAEHCKDIKNLDSKDDAYIAARFDILVASKPSKLDAALGAHVTNLDEDDGMSESDKAREKATKNRQNMWKGQKSA